jgi:ribose transport system permease protein
MNRQRWQAFTLHKPYLFSLLLLAIITLVNLFFQPNIFQRETLNSNMRVFLPLILLAAGQAVVILGGGIDISVGSIVSIVNVILATQVGMQGEPQKMYWMMGIVLLVGMLAGAINGFFVAYMRLQPIITTYATSFLYAGVALLIMPNPGGGIPPAFSSFYRNTTPLGLPLAFFVIALILLAWGLIQQTRYGRYLLAVGGKAEAAYATAVPVSRVKFSTYVIAGLMAAFSGIAITMLAGSGNAGTGDQMTLSSITAVVIGGTALSGGVGGVAGAVMGSVILGFIRNIISFAKIDTWWQTFVNAAIIVVALAAPGVINLFRRKRG